MRNKIFILFAVLCSLFTYGQADFPEGIYSGAGVVVDGQVKSNASKPIAPEDLTRKDYVDSNIDFVFNNMQVPFGSVPVILPTVGEDELTREIGNVVFDTNTNQYIMTYSGAGNPYTGGNTNIYWATSPTAEVGTWTKKGMLINTPTEDPYLHIIGSNYRLLAEKKDGNNHLGIELFTGSSMETLASQGIILAPTPGTLYAQDPSSPVEFMYGGKYTLIFEGRSSGNSGVIMFSESVDGINYTVNPIPIVTGSQQGNNTWFTHCVPDDIILLNGRYFLTGHVFNGTDFVGGVFESDDLITWKETLNTWLTVDGTNSDAAGNGIMLLRKDRQIYAFNVTNSAIGIYQGRLNVRGNDKFRYSSRVSQTTASELAASNRNEIIEFPLIANTTWQIRSDLSSNAGAYKIIKNTSVFTLTLQPLTGVTINGTTSNYTILAGDTILINLSDVNTWKVIPFPLLSVVNNKVTKGGDTGAFDIGTIDDTTWGFKRNNVVVADLFSSGMRFTEGFNLINRGNQNRFTMTFGTASAPSIDTRNVADAIATKRTTNANASSTGSIHEFANNTGVVSAIQRTGKITAVAGTASTDVIIKSQHDLKADLASPILTGNPTAPTPTAGDNDTSIATTAFATALARPYKVYTAIMIQSGTSAPVATVLENTLGSTVTWSYNTVGKYEATVSGALYTINKCVCFTSWNRGSSTYYYSGYEFQSTNSMLLEVSNSSDVNADGIFRGMIEIRVYN